MATKATYLLLLCCLSLFSSLANGQDENAEGNEARDLLHFLNGDYLHGEFLGMNNTEKVRWLHPDIADPIEIETTKMRRIALKQEFRSLDDALSSYIQLHNGDRIPGDILAMDQDSIRIATHFAQELTIPRNQISRLAPVPFGGKLFYYGPFSKNQWTILNEDSKSPAPEVPPLEIAPAIKEDADNEELTEDDWVFSGSAWYNNGNIPIALAANLPDQAIISFNLAWKNRLNAVVAFHASLDGPKLLEKENDANAEINEAQKARANNRLSLKNRYPLIYGESYVLSIIASYVQLHRCSFDAEGNPTVVALDSASFNVRLDEIGESTFELRCDRSEAQISLYVNGRFITQWTDREGYIGSGSNLAFASSGTNAKIRVSEVVVSSWNGMIDSAMSMESKDRDTILLTNGTDRFSGRVKNIENQNLILDGTFAEMSIPLSSIQAVHLAHKDDVPKPAPFSNQAARLLLYPVGRITVEPKQASQNSMECLFIGNKELSIDLKLIDVIEFSYGTSALDIWSEEF